MEKISTGATFSKKRSASITAEDKDPKSAFYVSVPERPKLQIAPNRDYILSTPREESPKTPKISSRTQSPTSSAKSYRTRGNLRGRTKVNYDMRFHPADEVLRPNHAAIRAARRITDTLEKKMTLCKKEDDDDNDNDNEISKSSVKQEVDVESERRFTRHGRQVKIADYDMKHHPMDDTLRPRAAVKRSVRFQGLSGSPYKSEGKHSHSSATTTSPGPAQVHNPFPNPVPEDWHSLNDLDRRLYQLQHGVPFESEDLPLKWSQVVERLIEEDLLSIEQLGAWGGHAALMRRYELVRLAIRCPLGLGVGDEKPTELKWMHVEDSSIFDLSSGQKYWRHQRDSFVSQLVDAVSSWNALQSTNETVQEPTLLADRAPSPVPLPEALIQNREQLLESDEGLMQILRNDISADIEPLMGEDEVEELISQQEGRKRQEGIVDPRKENFHDDVDQNNDYTSTTSTSDQLPIFRDAPPGVHRAARRLQEKKRFSSAEEKKTRRQNNRLGSGPAGARNSLNRFTMPAVSQYESRSIAADKHRSLLEIGERSLETTRDPRICTDRCDSPILESARKRTTDKTSDEGLKHPPEVCPREPM